MDIFEFAMNMELDGEKFYREMAEKASYHGIKNILNMLADEEKGHYEAINKIKASAVTVAESPVLDDAKNVFQRMKEYGEKFEVDTDQEQLYRKAMELEQKSVDFYQDRADQVEESYQKDLFLKLVDEEKKHFRMMEALADFVSNPDKWMEDAEFTHLDQY